jgi:hypothetical protein
MISLIKMKGVNPQTKEVIYSTFSSVFTLRVGRKNSMKRFVRFVVEKRIHGVFLTNTNHTNLTNL